MSYEISNYLVVQTEETIAYVNNPKMIAFIKKIELKDKVSEREIEREFGDKLSNAVNFLNNNRIITRFQSLNFNVNEVVLVSNNDDFLKLSRTALEITQSEVDISIFNISNVDEVKDDSLILSFLNPYNPEMVRSIYKKIKTKNNVFLINSFVYNFNFFMDNLYTTGWDNPDHFDHIGFIRSNIEGATTGEGISYSRLVDIIYENDSSFNVEFPLMTDNLIIILALLLERTKKLFSMRNKMHLHSSEEFLKLVSYNFKNDKVGYDSATFWELKDHAE